MIDIKSKKGAPYYTADPVEVLSSGLEQAISKGLFRTPPGIHGHTGSARLLFMVFCAADSSPSSPCFQDIKASSQAE